MKLSHTDDEEGFVLMQKSRINAATSLLINVPTVGEVLRF